MAFSHWVAVSTNFPRMKLVQFLQDWVDPKLAPNPSLSSGTQFKMLVVAHLNPDPWLAAQMAV